VDIAYETERLIARNWRPDDADRAYDIYSRMEVARWLGATPRPLASMDEANHLVTRWAELNDAEPDDAGPTEGRWALEHKDDGVVVGTVILVALPDGDGEVEVGWHLHPDSWGHGYATEAGRGALTLAFADGLEEVLAVVRPDNAPSIAVCRRLGMEELGLTDRYYGTSLELFRASAPAS
jgi:RimJ/RimL family protein N-acetyltransferase